MISSSSSKYKCSESETDQKPIVVVIAGPTGAGKSDVGARLCSNSEGPRGGIIISADSVQAYRGVQIGANKPSVEECKETPHLLIDVADHTENYNAAEWRRDALLAVSALLNPGSDEQDIDKDRRKEIFALSQEARKTKEISPDVPVLPVIVGGTMMYLQWLVHGRPDAIKPTKAAVDKAEEEISKYRSSNDFEAALDYVGSYGPLYAERLTKLCGKDWYRLRRTLEIALTMQKSSDRGDNSKIEQLFSGQRAGSLSSLGYDVRCFFLCPDDRMKHAAVVDERCEQMISRGLIQETADLLLSGCLPDMASRAIGYRQTLDYLEREAPKDGDFDALEAYIQDFKTATRRYAKKQMQWFRRDEEFVFVPVSLSKDRLERVKDATAAIEYCLSLPREQYDRECLLDEGSTSNQTKEANEKQGKAMKFYQFQRYIFKPDTDETKALLAVVDKCTNQIQAKKSRGSND